MCITNTHLTIKSPVVFYVCVCSCAVAILIIMSAIYEYSYVSDFIRPNKFISLYTIIFIIYAIKHGFVPINTSMCSSTKSVDKIMAAIEWLHCQQLRDFRALQLNGSFLVIEMIGQTNSGNNPNINMAFANDQMMMSFIG